MSVHFSTLNTNNSFAFFKHLMKDSKDGTYSCRGYVSDATGVEPYLCDSKTPHKCRQVTFETDEFPEDFVKWIHANDAVISGSFVSALAMTHLKIQPFVPGDIDVFLHPNDETDLENLPGTDKGILDVQDYNICLGMEEHMYYAKIIYVREIVIAGITATVQIICFNDCGGYSGKTFEVTVAEYMDFTVASSTLTVQSFPVQRIVNSDSDDGDNSDSDEGESRANREHNCDSNSNSDSDSDEGESNVSCTYGDDSTRGVSELPRLVFVMKIPHMIDIVDRKLRINPNAYETYTRDSRIEKWTNRGFSGNIDPECICSDEPDVDRMINATGPIIGDKFVGYVSRTLIVKLDVISKWAARISGCTDVNIVIDDNENNIALIDVVAKNINLCKYDIVLERSSGRIVGRTRKLLRIFTYACDLQIVIDGPYMIHRDDSIDGYCATHWLRKIPKQDLRIACMNVSNDTVTTLNNKVEFYCSPHQSPKGY